ncbi:MAG: hypothetical protein AAF798_01245 [Bacteroidota bacterium]
MVQSFTSNHLIKRLYDETSASEKLAINEAMTQDSALAEEYNQLLEAYQQLPQVTFAPKQGTLQNILGYSKRTALEKHA